MITAKALRLHDRCITAITGTARLRQEHVKVVVCVVALLEAVAAYGHAGRNAARATSICHHMWHPDQTALCMVIIAAYCRNKNKNKINFINQMHVVAVSNQIQITITSITLVSISVYQLVMQIEPIDFSFY